MERNPSREDYIYLAGLIDGEGCFAQHRTSGGVQFVVEMRDEAVLRWAHALFGGSIFFRDRVRPRWSPTWRWTVGRRAELQELIVGVLPHLRVKQEQARLVLAFLDVADTTPCRTDPQRIAAFEAMNGMNKRTT